MTVTAQQLPENAGPQATDSQAIPGTKKAFVEPTISSPVDVLEATTFFQTVDSGGTGLTKKKGGG